MKNDLKNKKINFAKCNVCGRFMRRLKFIEKIRLGLSGSERTHVCRKESIRYEDGVSEHE